jgi:hypothetical protein
MPCKCLARVQAEVKIDNVALRFKGPNDSIWFIMALRLDATRLTGWLTRVS